MHARVCGPRRCSWVRRICSRRLARSRRFVGLCVAAATLLVFRDARRSAGPALAPGAEPDASHEPPRRPSDVGDADTAAPAGCKAAFLYAGLVPPTEQLFRNNMEMLARPQQRAGCKVDVFLVLARTMPLSHDSLELDLRALRLHAADAGAVLVDTAHFEEDKAASLIDKRGGYGNRTQRIAAHRRSSSRKVALQNAMIKFKLLRAEAYERTHGVAYNWFIHLRCDSHWYAPLPPLSALAPGVTYLPGFGRYGGVNDRFAIVPREHRRVFFEDRFDRWLRNDFSFACEAMCPCDEGICLDNSQCADSSKFSIHNNECLLRTMLLDAHVPMREHGFSFSIVKNYRGRAAPCVVYWGECQHLGEHECRCLLSRCENTELLNKEASDKLLLGAGEQAAARAPAPGRSTTGTPNTHSGTPGGTGAQKTTVLPTVSSLETPLTPADYDSCRLVMQSIVHTTWSFDQFAINDERSNDGERTNEHAHKLDTINEWQLLKLIGASLFTAAS